MNMRTHILMHTQWENERLTIEFTKTKAKLAQITELEFVFNTFINYLTNESLSGRLQYFYTQTCSNQCNNFS